MPGRYGRHSGHMATSGILPRARIDVADRALAASSYVDKQKVAAYYAAPPAIAMPHYRVSRPPVLYSVGLSPPYRGAVEVDKCVIADAPRLRH